MPENIINRSSLNLDKFEKHVLGLGLTFNLPPTEKDIVSTAAALDKFLFRNREKLTKNSELVRGIVSPLLLSIQKETPLLPKSLYLGLKRLQKNRNVKIMPADKGGKVVVMDVSEYDSKIMNLLSDDDTYEHLHRNPLKENNAMIRSSIGRIAKTCPDPTFFKKFLTPNCRLAYIYGIPKVHKTNCPLRPIISNVSTATRSLAGWLAGCLTPYLGKFSGSHLKNSMAFKERMQDFARDNSTNIGKLVSLDVTSLFTNVPTDEVISFLGRRFDALEISLPVPKKEFLELIRLCVNNNFFQFKDQFFRQKFGISMGSPLSPVLANLYMEYFEAELLPTLAQQPLLWLRYVDDVLLFWPDELDFEAFFRDINGLVPSIKFTTEWEADGMIPFLDTKVHRLTTGFSFEVYRKPTHSNQFIHYFSWQPEHVKRSSVFSLLLRAYRISDSFFLESELDYLYQAFSKVGFPRGVIDQVHCRVKRKFYCPIPSPSVGECEDEPPPPVLSLPHNHFVDSYVKPVIKANNCRVVNHAGNSMRSQLVCNRPLRSEAVDERAGVYRVPCQNCPKSYFGETGRPFNVRLKEHKSAVQKGDLRNACFKHISDTSHDIDWSNAKLLYSEDDWYRRLVLESSCMAICPNFNNMRSTLGIDQFSARLILKSRPELDLAPP